MIRRMNNERGQALILIALAMVGLVGIVGLAIDGSAKFSDQRHAQNAADTAAIAAALAKVDALTAGESNSPAECPPPGGMGDASDVCIELILAGLDRAESNGYDNSTNKTVEIYSPPKTGYYAGDDNYVQVIITSVINTTFARVLGFNQLQNVVEATTYMRKGGPIFEGNSMVALNPHSTCPGSFRVGGSSTIVLDGGGMFVNSDSTDCAFEQQGGCSSTGDPLLVILDGGISSPGDENVDLDSCMAEEDRPDITYNADPFLFPDDVELPDVPPECSMTGFPTPTNAVVGGVNTTYLYPGRYGNREFPPKTGDFAGVTIYDDVVMTPGVYCIDDLVKLNDRHLILTGTGVTLYIRDGHGFAMQGGRINLAAPTTGDYAGYLIIVETNFTGSPESCSINGSPDNSYGGTIFAPYCNVTINGTSSSGDPLTTYSTQVIAYEIILNGTSRIYFNYDPDASAQNKRRVGLMK
jgi:hypothetical protein